METSVLNANGVIANSGAHVIDQISGVNVGFTIMFIVTLFSVGISFYLMSQLLTVIRDSIKANQELKGVIQNALDKQD